MIIAEYKLQPKLWSYKSNVYFCYARCQNWPEFTTNQDASYRKQPFKREYCWV